MKKHNRIKDIIIDHVFDHCFNEVVQRVEGNEMKLTFDGPEALADPETKEFLDQIRNSGASRSFYTTRGVEFCKVLVKEGTLHKQLIDKLLAAGFKKGRNLYENVKQAHDELVMRSYLSRNQPITNEVKLTEKGIRHYLNGKSFEDDFLARRNSVIAIVISVCSAVIALIALFWNK